MYPRVFSAQSIVSCQAAISMATTKGVALVTGAAQGIGKGIALRLADDGFDVAINDLASNADMVAALVDEIKAKGRASSPHLADVSVDEQVKNMIDQVVQLHGSLDVCVANAGIMKYSSFADTSVEEFDKIMGVNARSTFSCFKYAGMQMIRQGKGGRIIGASSVGGKRGFFFATSFYTHLLNGVVGGAQLSAYSASKFAIRGLTQCAACEFGPHGITVNSYAPGTTDTPMLNYMDEAHSETTGKPSGSLKGVLKQAGPLGMIATPDDIAGLVSFIASKESQFITGQCISINGGMYFD
ncbi:NAD-binding protein [Mycena kentingensis (nom. inval.)]|nr:NAD-binding protein [Mycena kentingensis (nom. inval.)]